MSENSLILEGIISVQSAIEAKKRKIECVYIDKEKAEKRDRKVTRLLSLLKRENISFSLSSREFINGLCDGETHGGVVAKASERTYTALTQMLQDIGKGEYAVMLDGVEDPFNFGYSIRNLYAFGCKNFIVPKRNWMTSCAVVAKASAGASELCEMAISENDDELVSLIKSSKLDIVCSALAKDSVSLFEFSPKNGFVLFGGEKRGISKTFMENADTILHIPYSNENAKYSLPTASCAAIISSFLSSRKDI